MKAKSPVLQLLVATCCFTAVFAVPADETAEPELPAAGKQTSTYLVPGVAHAPGAAGTNWRTKLSVLNRSGATAQVTLDYVRTSKMLTETITLSDGQLRAWEDVAVDLFGITADSSGAIVVASTRPLKVSARTYNQGSAGTFGQFLPGVDESRALIPSDTGVLSMLSKSSSFRTNIGFVNLGGSSCNVRVTLHAPSGATIGSPRTVTVPAQGWKQENDIFTTAGAGTRNDAYATVEVLTSGCEVWGYGSVVDNSTGDPTTVPLVGGSGGSVASGPAITGFSGGDEWDRYFGDSTGDVVGYRFTVTSPIEVTALGVWSADTRPGNEGLTSSHQLGLWNASQTLLAIATAAPGGTVVGDWTYASINPVVLSPGQTYTAGAVYNGDDLDRYVSGADSMSTAAEITWLNAVRPTEGNLGLVYPGFDDTSGSQGRFGPNLMFAAR